MGLVEARSENVAISVPVPGLVTALHVQAGQRVNKGQPLFSLDDRDLRAELDLRESSLEPARARWEQSVRRYEQEVLAALEETENALAA